MLNMNVMINVMIIDNRTATCNGPFSLAHAAGLRKYVYGNGFTVMDSISGTTLIISIERRYIFDDLSSTPFLRYSGHFGSQGMSKSSGYVQYIK